MFIHLNMADRDQYPGNRLPGFIGVAPCGKITRVAIEELAGRCHLAFRILDAAA